MGKNTYLIRTLGCDSKVDQVSEHRNPPVLRFSHHRIPSVHISTDSTCQPNRMQATSRFMASTMGSSGGVRAPLSAAKSKDDGS